MLFVLFFASLDDAARAIETTVRTVVPDAPAFTAHVVVVPDASLKPGEAARSVPGRLLLRHGPVSDVTWRHEVAHHYLWQACPQSAGDRLFHEAFAISASGELETWLDEGYFSSVKAVDTLQRAESLDTPSARQALARLLGDGAGRGLPAAVAVRLKRCLSGAAMTAMALSELHASAQPLRGDAFFVLNRHSGETLVAEGDVDVAFPFGSTLKPFTVTADAPVLTANPADPLWRCGDLVQMSAAQALALSCNGYFLAWKPTLGAFGDLFLALGMERLPRNIDELIGLRPTLALTPSALAQAYRVLAEMRPEVLAMLKQTARIGTLSGMPESERLQRYALKTGTVRDPESRVEQGWIVAVDDDRIAVMTVRGRMPRAFAGRLLDRLQHISPLQGAASVQVFALAPDVQVMCPGVGVRDLRVMPRSFQALGGRMLCLGAPMTVRLASALGTDRTYAGVFSEDRVARRSADEPKARAGSDWIFRTSERLYVAGVLRAEDASLVGQAQLALAKVIQHNVHVDRHAGRPICDTTHCQAFLGTPHTRKAPLDWRQLHELPLHARGWLPFSRGGDEAWQDSRPVDEVAKILGALPSVLHFAHGKVRFAGAEANTTDEVWQELPCERLRNPLKLLSCPTSAIVHDDRIAFTGSGRGHGEGLDVEAAKKDGLPAERILEKAYYH